MTFLSNRFLHSEELNNRDNRIIVFVNSKLSNCAFLVQQVVPKARAIVIGSQADGIQEITRILKLSNCQEMHIITDGYPGCLYLGSTELSINTFIQYTPELKSWFEYNNINSSLDSPKICLYGSNVAAGDVGDEFITKLSQTTTAEITASANLVNTNILVHS